MNHPDFKQLFFQKQIFSSNIAQKLLTFLQRGGGGAGNPIVCLVKDGKHLTVQFKCRFINSPQSNSLFTNVNISIFSGQ